MSDITVPDYANGPPPLSTEADALSAKRPGVVIQLSKGAAGALGATLLACVVTIVVLASGGGSAAPAAGADDFVPRRSVQGCTSDDAPPSPPAARDLSNCRVSIAGAGPGGVYTAWRLAKDGVAARPSILPDQICVFERTERLGGRIFSVRNLGPYGDLVVESGAYRFSSYGATPLLTALIQEGVNGGAGLPYVAYDTTHNKIVSDPSDPDSNAGYVTFVEVMLEEAVALGVRFFPKYELVSMNDPVTPATLTSRDWTRGGWAPRFELLFANGERTVSAIHVANMMQQPLLQVLQASSLSFAPTTSFSDPEARSDSETALYLSKPNIACKFYVYYENAWWRTAFDQNGEALTPPADEILRRPGPDRGSYEDEAPNAMSMILDGRYHDGHSRCVGGRCYGFLMTVYSTKRDGRTDPSPCTIFEKYQLNTDPPVRQADCCCCQLNWLCLCSVLTGQDVCWTGDDLHVRAASRRVAAAPHARASDGLPCAPEHRECSSSRLGL